jgi:hypothetical protein
MKSHRVFAIVPVALAFQAAVISAQSLADVARAEEARRKTVKASVKVYTNEDLDGAPATGAAQTPSTAPTAGPAKPGDAAAKPDEQKPVDPTKTEKYWKDRAAEIQQSLSRSKILLEALQTQVSGMNAEFLSMDDPGQRGLLEARLQRASGELQRVQQDIDKQTKAAADLQEEARKSGVPAGWIR